MTEHEISHPDPEQRESALRRDWVQVYLARLGLAEIADPAEKPLSDE